MDEEKEKIADIIEQGLKLLRYPNDACVISECEEADARNEDDHMRAYAYLDGKSVDLCTKANAKEGYVEVFDIKENKDKMLFGDVKILRWDRIAQKRDPGEQR